MARAGREKLEAAKPVDASSLAGLAWATPAAEVNPPVTLDQLLQGLQLLASDEARKTGVTFVGGTPPSLQAIKSGALSTTKWASGAVAGVGGLTGAAAAVAGAIKTFSGDAGQPATVALIAGAAVLLAAVALALSIFVAADLVARGIATAARHEGRAEVASAFLSATSAMPTTRDSGGTTDQQLLQILAAFPGRVVVTTDALTDQTVQAVAVDSTGVVTYVLATDRIKSNEITSFKVI